MVVSGAFFGDKLSPLSDTTNLAAAVAGTDLFSHIRSVSLTTVPSFVLSIAAFYLIGRNNFSNQDVSSTEITGLLHALEKSFVISPWLFMPVLLVLIMSMFRIPAVIALMAGAITGIVCSVMFQGNNVPNALNVMNTGYAGNSGIPKLDSLLNRGGIVNMMETFVLSFIALSIGSLLDELGYLRTIVMGLLQQVRYLGSLIALVIGTCFLTNGLMGEIYLSIIVNGNLFSEEFTKRGLQRSMLSRTLEEGTTMTGPLIPWTTAGAFIGGVLGVSAFDYVWYAFFNLINPLVAVVFAYTGIAVLRKKLTSSLP
ncbi:TPA: hypothetical protein OND39_004500 [Enterobacter asburiae]|nr:hypothetical protein [Enterobacter asburiae]